MARTLVDSITVGGCETRYIGPTNYRPARVSAKHITTGKRVIVSWDHELDTRENHEAAALKLLGYSKMVCASTDKGWIFLVHPDAYKVNP